MIALCIATGCKSPPSGGTDDAPNAPKRIPASKALEVQSHCVLDPSERAHRFQVHGLFKLRTEILQDRHMTVPGKGIVEMKKGEHTEKRTIWFIGCDRAAVADRTDNGWKCVGYEVDPYDIEENRVDLFTVRTFTPYMASSKLVPNGNSQLELMKGEFGYNRMATWSVSIDRKDQYSARATILYRDRGDGTYVTTASKSFDACSISQTD